MLLTHFFVYLPAKKIGYEDSMISKIKDFFLSKYLADNNIVRHPNLYSIEQAESIGILCEITDEASYKSIFRVFNRLQQEGHRVKMVGYVNAPEVPFYCLPQLSADYFCNKHLNWYGYPKTVQIHDFMKHDFDMLLDFNFRCFPAVKVILSQSKAKCIVGRDPGSQPLYDLFINAPGHDEMRFLDEVCIYTQKLTGNEKQ